MKSALTLFTALLLAPLASVPAANAPISQTALVTLHPEKPGVQIPADFLGFSCEKTQLAREHLQPTNAVVMNLFRNLGAGVLRIGGSSQDSVGWSRTEMNPPANGPKNSKDKALVIGPAAVYNCYAFAKRVGWKVVYGLNLGANDPAMAADEAAYAVQAGGPMLLALEIGNEPNLYHEGSKRPPNYGYAQYRQEVESYDRVILSKLPHAPLAGPATTFARKWFTDFFADFKTRIVLATAHIYPLAAKEENPEAPRFATVENLLSGKTAQNTEKNWLPQLEVSSAGQIPFRISECNTASSGGKSGVSDVFASALWGIDFLFQVAEHGGAGINFHGGFKPGGYAPIHFFNNRYRASPLYYSMLLFRQAACGRVLPVECQAAVNVTAHAVLGDDRKLRVVLINKDLSRPVEAFVAPGSLRTKAEVIRLSAPSVTSTEDVTLAGSAVREDGTWTPQPGEPVPCVNGRFEVPLPAASAALLTIE